MTSTVTLIANFLLPSQDSILATIESMKVTLANLARRTCQQALEQVCISAHTCHWSCITHDGYFTMGTARITAELL
jgi:hypothetical protein